MRAVAVVAVGSYWFVRPQMSASDDRSSRAFDISLVDLIETALIAATNAFDGSQEGRKVV
ncbi:MAG: hypothetical protein M3546_13235 [Actinomycetota bacterium]|nr:hypothetical protein [Actinomycetota bacterium]